MKLVTVFLMIGSLLLVTGCARVVKKGHVGHHKPVAMVVVVPVKR
ncbi:MAG: hypothetical protein ACPGUE_10750 [Marinomonas sp.]